MLNYWLTSHYKNRPEQPKCGELCQLSSSRANSFVWNHLFVLYEIIPNLLFSQWLFLQAERSQSIVLKSNLQTPTWLPLISHGLFITAITSPHIFIPSSASLYCCWPALLPLFSSIWLTSPLSLHPQSLFWFTASCSAHSSLFFLAPLLSSFIISFYRVPIFFISFWECIHPTLIFFPLTLFHYNSTEYI